LPISFTPVCHLAFTSIGGVQNIDVTFFGVRGSTPCHGDDTRRYGGNTSCVGLSAPNQPPLVFDLGTGLRYCGDKIPATGPFEGHCLLTHMHWDHVQGLPFFVPTLRDGANFQIFGPMQDDGRSVHDVFEAFIKPPMFPVSVTSLPGTFVFHDVADSDFHIAEMQVKSRFVPHVGNTLGFRVNYQSVGVTYLPDHQMPQDGSMGITDGARELCEGADLLIHDAQYTPEEFTTKSNWGHCTVDYAVWVAIECGVKKLALFHHDPTRSDDAVDELLAAAKRRGEKHGVEVFAAAENQVVSLPCA
jgi:phosphoribosyl 1,2-cyclic phosphodiesterase